MFCSFCESLELLIRHPDHDAYYCETCDKSYTTEELENVNESLRKAPSQPSARRVVFDSLYEFFAGARYIREPLYSDTSEQLWKRSEQQSGPRTDSGTPETSETKRPRIRLVTDEMDRTSGEEEN